MAEVPVLVVVGPPGSGKTTIGTHVATALEVPFHDTDQAVEVAAGRSTSDIFVQDGEAAFRALERSEVLRALQQEAGAVVSLGGGAVLDADVRAALTAYDVVFLDVGIADAAGRVGFDASRPLLVVNPRASWQRLMTARRPLYEEVATWRVDTAGRSPQEVADAVLALLEAPESAGE
ncbi:MAG: shikimate kinase [Ornithinimicrobium sp.]|uniref:shikimate kinase n=1 Tax=Ornithinimicrobium sp. TaxID=1977084 RepID=UPI003D9B97C7